MKYLLSTVLFLYGMVYGGTSSSNNLSPSDHKKFPVFQLINIGAATSNIHNPKVDSPCDNCKSCEELTSGNPAWTPDSVHHYYYVQNQSYWAVVGLRPDPNTNYDISLYDSVDLLSCNMYNRVAQSTYGPTQVDFIVRNFNKLWPFNNVDGITVRKRSGTGWMRIDYDGDNQTLDVNRSYQLYWPRRYVAKIWDVQLTPGKYKITLNVTNSLMDFGVGLYFPRSSGSHTYTRSQLTHYSDNPQGQDESFEVTITQEDWYGLIVWSNTGADESGGTIYLTIARLPDLVVRNQYASPTTVHPGDNINVYAQVVNIQHGYAQESHVGYYLSTSPNNTGRFLDSKRIPALSDSGNYGDANKTIQIPNDVSPGSYYIVLKADYRNEVEESNEDNNIASVPITITQPNHSPVTSQPEGPARGVVGDTLSYRATVYDQDGDSVSIQFDWGDGTRSNWSEFKPNGRTFRLSHSWMSPGIYEVKARGKDKRGAIGDWSIDTTVVITQPHDPTISRVRPMAQDTTINAGSSLPFVVNVSDEDGDLNRVVWRMTKNGSPIRDSVRYVSGTSASSSTTWSFDSPGNYRIYATVYDQRDRDSSTYWNVQVVEASLDTFTIGNLKITAQSINPVGDNQYRLMNHVCLLDLSNRVVIDFGSNSEVEVNTSINQVLVQSYDPNDNSISGFFRIMTTGSIQIIPSSGAVLFSGELQFGTNYQYMISSDSFQTNINTHTISGEISFVNVDLFSSLPIPISANIDLDSQRASLNFEVGYKYSLANGRINLNILHEGAGFSFDFRTLIFRAWTELTTNVFEVEVPLSEDVRLVFKESPLPAGGSIKFDITLDIPQRALYFNKDAEVWASFPVPTKDSTSYSYVKNKDGVPVSVSIGVKIDSSSYIHIQNNSLTLVGGGSLGLGLTALGLGIEAWIAHLTINTVLAPDSIYFNTTQMIGIGEIMEVYATNETVIFYPRSGYYRFTSTVAINNYPMLLSFESNFDLMIDLVDSVVSISSNAPVSILGFNHIFISQNAFLWNYGFYGRDSLNLSLLDSFINFYLNARGKSDFQMPLEWGEITRGVSLGPIDINTGAGYSMWTDTMQVYADIWGHIYTYTFVHHSTKGDTNVVEWRFNPYDGITASLRSGLLKGVTGGGDTIVLADTMINLHGEDVAAWLHPEVDSSKGIILNKMINIDNTKNSLREVDFESAGADSLNMDLLVPGEGCKYLYKIHHNTADNTKAKAEVPADGGVLTLLVDIDGNGTYEDTLTIAPDTIPSYKDGGILYVRHPVKIDMRNDSLDLSWTTSIPTRSIIFWGSGVSNIADTLYNATGYTTDYNLALSTITMPDSFYINVISITSRGAELTQGPIYINKRMYGQGERDTLMLQSAIGAPGTSVRVPVVLNHQDIVSAIQTTIAWDSSVLKFHEITIDSQLTNFSVSHNNFGDSLRIVMVSLSGDSILPGMDTLFYITFVVDSNISLGDSTYLSVEDAILSDPHGRHLSVVPKGAWVYIMGLKGDLNQDGIIDVTDVVREINIILLRPPAPTPYEEWAGDMNNDNTIDVTDVVAIINVILGRGEDKNGSSGKAIIWKKNNKIFVNSSCSIGGMQFDLMGNVSELRAGRDIEGLSLFKERIPGGFRILIVGINGSLLESGIREILRYAGKGEINNIVLSDKYGKRIQVNNVTINEVKLFPVIPNPASKIGYIRFVLPKAMRVKIGLYDVTGREVHEIANRRYDNGYHELKINLKNIPSGVYIIRLNAGKVDRTQKFIVK